jgi:hypothetical protein
MQCDRLGGKDSGAKSTSKKDPGKEEVSMAPPIFTLVEDGDGKFVLDGNIVRTAAALDYETAPSHTIVVGVSGVVPAIANQSITITVENIVEVSTIQLDATSISESAAIGAAVGVFSVTGATGTPVYSLVNDAGGKFALDGATLEVAAPLDYESATSHGITVSVTGITPPTDNAVFTIDVIDVGPVVSSYYPTDNATDFPYNDDLVATFAVPISLNAGTIYLKQSADNVLVDSWDVEDDTGAGPGNVEVVSSTQLTLHLSAALTDSVGYYVTWDAGVVKDASTDEAVLALSSSTAWNFTATVPSGYDIFLTTGDSNLMTGASFDISLDYADIDVKQLGYTAPNTDLVISAQEPLDYASQGRAIGVGFIGHDSHFAIDYYKRLGHLKSPRQVLLVVDGIGGSAVSVSWNADSGTVGNPTAVGFELTLATTRLATALALSGTNQVMGVLDSEVVNNYLAYGNATGSSIIGQYRRKKYREIQYLRNLAGPTVPIVVCRASKIAINADLGDPYGTNGIAHDRILQSIPKHFPYTAVADSQVPTELVAAGDNIHFTAAEQRILAERYYTAWLAAQSNTGRVVVWDPDCWKIVDGFTYGLIISNGGLDVENDTGAGWKIARSTGPLRSGKAYCEIKIVATGGFFIVGFCNSDCLLAPDLGSAAAGGHSAGMWGSININQVFGYTQVYAGVPNAWAVNDVVMLAVDMATGKGWYGKNGTWISGDPAAGTGEWISGIIDPVHIAACMYDNTFQVRLQPTSASFTHTPPTGFSAWQEDVPTPSVLTYFPADNSTNVINALGKIYARFNCALTFGASGTITLKKTSDNSTVQTWNVATDQGYTAGKVGIINEYLLVMYLSASLGQGIEYYVVFDAGIVKNIENETNAAQASTTAWSFTSVDLPTPAPVTYSPIDNATGVSIHNPFTVTFNTPVVLGTGNITLKKTSDNSTIKTWSVTTDAGSAAGKVNVIDSNQLVLRPDAAIAANTEFYVIWDAGVVANVAGETVAANASTTLWSFTTETTASLLLDQFTVGLCYSPRKLRTAFAGSCYRIRRSSDNAEQDFGFVANVVDLAGIATFVGGGSGYIVTNYDQSGNGMDPTNATASQQSLFVASASHSKSAARIDGVDDHWRKNGVSLETITNLDECTVFWTAKQDGTQTNNIAFGFKDAVSGRGISLSPTIGNIIHFGFGDVTSAASPGILQVNQPSGWDDAFHITECFRTTAADNNTQGIYVDGANLRTEFGYSSALVADTDDFILGTYTANFKGDFSELIIIKTGLDAVSRGTIRRNIGTYYGVTVS